MSESVVMEANLAADPRVFEVDGRAGVQLRVIETPRLQVADGTWHDAEPIAHTVVAWGSLAENAGHCLRRGDRIVVAGTTYTDTWTREGEQHEQTKIKATHLGLSLRWWAPQSRADEPMGRRARVRTRKDEDR